MSLTKEDLQAITNSLEPLFDKKLAPLQTRLDSVDARFDSVDDSFGTIEEQLSTLATQEEVKTMFREQKEQIHRAFKDSAELVLHTHPTREEYEELKSRVEELEDIIDTSKKSTYINHS